MKRAIKCGRNGRERITVNVAIPDLTVILTTSSVIWPNSLTSDFIAMYRKMVFAIIAKNTVNPAEEVSAFLNSQGFTVLNPCDTQFFTF